jgi:hypothetical protein
MLFEIPLPFSAHTTKEIQCVMHQIDWYIGTQKL